MLNKLREKTAKKIFELLPEGTEEVVKGDKKRQQEVSIIVKEIFEKYGKDISVLSKS